MSLIHRRNMAFMLPFLAFLLTFLPRLPLFTRLPSFLPAFLPP